MAMNYTHGRTKKKVNNIHSHVSRQRHIRESNESDGLEGIFEES